MTLKTTPATAELEVRSELVRHITEMMATGQQALECAIDALEQDRTDIAVRALTSAAKAGSSSAAATLTLQEHPGNSG